MKIAAGIVTNRGGRTCHAAIIARELGIPAVVGAGDATTRVPDGEVVTVSCVEGDTGRVYRGEVGFHVDRTEVGDLSRPRTQIMINLGNPDLAFKTSFLPNDGVGLARMEFIVSEYIKVHPLALLHDQTFLPYTDLLLHDLGPDLADGRPDHLASGQEWRTPPLWGIGLTGRVNGHSFFLHDGRARNLTEAILWHDGEARKARDRFAAADKAERDALIKFLESL